MEVTRGARYLPGGMQMGVVHVTLQQPSSASKSASEEYLAFFTATLPARIGRALTVLLVEEPRRPHLEDPNKP